jgi:excisionase family DNA binding protein
MNTGDGIDPRSPGPTSGPDRSQPVSRRLISLAEAATILSVSIPTARRLISSGRLPATRLSRRVLVDVKDLDRLIERSKEGGFWR